MATELQKQVLVGGLVGLFICAASYIALGGKREELDALRAGNNVLKQEVDKGIQLKANYDKLKAEVDQQNKQLEELIAIMPSDLDRGEMPNRIKKLADSSGIEQVSWAIQAPEPKEYHVAHPYKFTFRAGFHEFGQFASLISGYDKIINLSSLSFKRQANPFFPITVECTISAFVYDPTDPKTKPADAAGKPK